MRHLQDLPGYITSNQPGIRKLALDLAAAALMPGAGKPPKQVTAAAAQLLLSGVLPDLPQWQAGNLWRRRPVMHACLRFQKDFITAAELINQRGPQISYACGVACGYAGMADKDALVRAKATQHLGESFPTLLGSDLQLQPILHKVAAR